MAGAVGQRQAGKDAEKNIKAVVEDDPDFYDSGSGKVKDDRPRVTGKTPPPADVEDDPEEAEAKAELDSDKDALAADKQTDVGDRDAETIDAQPENDVEVKD
ncbi:hypothetical protein WJX73_005366 [Symbiochloris irregularis]|uniref:Uncharacterized protein n=1 Tax=Symbiochloris irregularis TaxID=706552 RepID=A0AAW1Q3U8_9CHLO